MTQQIDDRLQGYETDNLKVIQAAEGVHTARQAEDAAYRRFSGKDHSRASSPTRSLSPRTT